MPRRVSIRIERGGSMNRHDIASGFFLLAIAIFALVKAVELGVGTFLAPGPGFVFFWSGVILGVLSIVLALGGMIGRKKPTRLVESFKGLKWYQPLAVTVALFLYATFLDYLGFLLATFLILLLLVGLGRPKPWVTVGWSLLTVLVTYLIFHEGLQIQFPVGLLSF